MKDELNSALETFFKTDEWFYKKEVRRVDDLLDGMIQSIKQEEKIQGSSVASFLENCVKSYDAIENSLDWFESRTLPENLNVYIQLSNRERRRSEEDHFDESLKKSVLVGFIEKSIEVLWSDLWHQGCKPLNQHVNQLALMWTPSVEEEENGRKIKSGEHFFSYPKDQRCCVLIETAQAAEVLGAFYRGEVTAGEASRLLEKRESCFCDLQPGGEESRREEGLKATLRIRV